jgi:hypothetical protein
MALIFLLLISIQAVMSAEFDLNFKVTWVQDGDTVRVAIGDWIRLADINAPEINHSGYAEAKNFLYNLVYDKTVYLDIDDLYRNDSYGRLVCVVYVGYNATHYLNVNKALLNGGFAVLDDYPNEFNPSTWTLYISTGDVIQPGQAGGDNTLFIIAAAIIIIIIIAVLVYFLMLRKIDPTHATMTGSSLKRNIVG